MSFFRRQLISQSKNGSSSVAKIKMICVVEDSNNCAVGVQGAIRQALGITFATDYASKVKVTLKRNGTTNILFSDYIEPHPLLFCFEIYDLFPEESPYQISTLEDSYYITNDTNYILGEQNFYELEMELEINEGQEYVELNSTSFNSTNPNDTAKTPTATYYYCTPLYQVISKTNNVIINDSVWHPSAIKE